MRLQKPCSKMLVLRADERGASLIEYITLTGMFMAALIFSVGLITDSADAVFQEAGEEINEDGRCAPPLPGWPPTC